MACLALIGASQHAASAAATVGSDPQPLPGSTIPSVPGLGSVDTPGVTSPPKPLGSKSGTVAVSTGQHVTSSRTRTAAAAGITTMAVTTDQVALRALVVGLDSSDFGVATWKAMLDRVGAAYDVLYASTTPVTADTLVDAAGVGKYNAILLSNSMLLMPDFTSAFDATEWNLVWAYERDYKVRQVALYSSYGSFPEDYCTRAGTEASVGATGITATLTTAGAGVFDYLRTTARVPIVESYVYRTSIAAGCAATPILQVGTAVLGVTSTSTDGRERATLTFTSNLNLMQSHLLTYGLFRWATRGLYFGEQRHYLNVDVDDWFNSSDHLYADGHLETDPGFQRSAHDAYNAYLQQIMLRLKFTVASSFTFNLAYNGGDANLAAGNRCSAYGGISQLTATTKCLRAQFRWLNHSVSHPKMNSTDYATTLDEIDRNLAIAQTLGLTVDRRVFKSPEYSGLGVYNPDPTDDVSPPTDYGLAASNPEMLRAAKDAGVKYLHGNMSFVSHQPACFNCAVTHPMEPSLSIVPDWPTNIAYFSTTPAEETYFYNSFYGPNGRFPYWSANLTYAQLLDYEAGLGLAHLATGSIYTHTFHISNLRDYGSGKTLVTDWVNAVLTKYNNYYKVPLRTPAWGDLAQYAVGRNTHFAGIAAGVQGVYNSTTKTVTVTSPVATTVTVSGAKTAGYSTYGVEVSAPITLAAGGSVTFAPVVRS
jgi:hypothetical protein